MGQHCAWHDGYHIRENVIPFAPIYGKKPPYPSYPQEPKRELCKQDGEGTEKPAHNYSNHFHCEKIVECDSSPDKTNEMEDEGEDKGDGR